jgi:GGDEF domain-containing protein
VLLPALGASDAEQVATRIRASIVRLSRYGQAISTGIGVASYPADARSPEALLEAADRRLLSDKYGYPSAA